MTVKEMGACRGNTASLLLSSGMAASDNPDKAWLRRILKPRTETPVLPAPERQPRPDARSRADTDVRPADVPFTPEPEPPPKKAPEASPAPQASRAAPVPNVEPARGRVIKQSERLTALRTGLTTRAHDMAAAMPRDADAAARAGLDALWQRIGGLSKEIERQQRAEDSEARIERQRGGEIER